MARTARIDRLVELGARLRERAAAELARRAAAVAAVERELVSLRDAETEARAVATNEPEAGATLVLAWAYADGLARRAMGLLDERARALTAAEGAYEEMRERRRREQELAHLAARARERDAASEERERDRALDDVARWSQRRRR
jgi:flagellar export protein FliJ